VVLYAMGLDEPRALLERTGAPQRAEGRAVAAHQVLERYARCMENFRQAVFHADLAFLIDASDANAGGPRLMATVAARRVHLHVPLRPRWVDRALGFSEK
jgi:predicted ABC-type ATPase